jgi:hypothetical protein
MHRRPARYPLVTQNGSFPSNLYKDPYPQTKPAPHGEPMEHFAVDPLTEAHDLGTIGQRQEPILGHQPLSIVDQPQKTSCAGCV